MTDFICSGVEVAVQLLPEWPFMGVPQLRSFQQLSWHDPEPMQFMLPR